jgi:DNA-binding transcriptional LysR family regulator
MNKTFACLDTHRGPAMNHPGSAPLTRRYLRHGMLPQLLALDTVIRLGSARRAAEVLCVAPPTLSGQLRKLGEQLGVRLFETHGRRRVPTEAARTLALAAQEVTAAFERCERQLGDLRRFEP